MSTSNRSKTHTYILRCWEEEHQHKPDRSWRFVLEDPCSGKRVGFATLQAFVAFITSVSPADQWVVSDKVNIT